MPPPKAYTFGEPLHTLSHVLPAETIEVGVVQIPHLTFLDVSRSLKSSE